jgi:hypothetical protein
METGKTESQEHILNLLKPSGFFTYHQVEPSNILHGTRFAWSLTI